MIEKTITSVTSSVADQEGHHMTEKKQFESVTGTDSGIVGSIGGGMASGSIGDSTGSWTTSESESDEELVLHLGKSEVLPFLKITIFIFCLIFTSESLK